MAKSISAPGLKNTAQLQQEAAGVAGDMAALGNKMPGMAKASVAKTIGELGHSGVSQSANPLAKSAMMAGQTARGVVDTQATAAKEGLDMRAQAVKASGEAAMAGKDAYNTAYAAMTAEKERLGGFGGWMTGAEKRQFRQFRDQQAAGLSPEQAARFMKAAGDGSWE